MGRAPRIKKKKRPKSELSNDEDFKPGEDHIGIAMTAKKVRDAKKAKKQRADNLAKRKRE